MCGEDFLLLLLFSFFFFFHIFISFVPVLFFPFSNHSFWMFLFLLIESGDASHKGLYVKLLFVSNDIATLMLWKNHILYIISCFRFKSRENHKLNIVFFLFFFFFFVGFFLKWDLFFPNFRKGFVKHLRPRKSINVCIICVRPVYGTIKMSRKNSIDDFNKKKNKKQN